MEPKPIISLIIFNMIKPPAGKVVKEVTTPYPSLVNTVYTIMMEKSSFILKFFPQKFPNLFKVYFT